MTLHQGDKVSYHWVITNISYSSSAALSSCMVVMAYNPARHFDTPTHWDLIIIIGKQ